MPYPQFEANSPVIRISETSRLIHIPIVLPISAKNQSGSLHVDLWEVSTAIGAFLAIKDFNNRNPWIVPILPKLIEGCDIQLTTAFYDSELNPLRGAEIVASLLKNETHTLETPYPSAIVGLAYSSEAKPSATLGGVYGVPIISNTASSPDLNNRDTFPTFARVIPSDESNAIIIVEYLQSLGVGHFGLIYVRDDFGTSYARSIHDEARKRGVHVVSFSFTSGIVETVKAAVAGLKKTMFKYFMAIPFSNNDIEILREASRAEIAGPGFAWFTTDSRAMDSEFNPSDFEIMRALNGLGILTLQPEVSNTAIKALADFQFETSLQREFLSSIKDLREDLFDHFNLTLNKPLFSTWVSLTYDAVLVPAIAACVIEKDLFTKEQLLQAISRVDFEGTTGHIRLLRDTMSRDPSSVQFGLKNLFLDETSYIAGNVRFHETTSILINLDSKTPFRKVTPFVYSDNTTTAPPDLPILKIDMNLISFSSRLSGLCFCGVTILVAIGWILFIYIHRNARPIKASQPPFLYMLCIGIIFMAFSIIPMSFQEPLSKQILDISCSSQLWLLSGGFTTTFSALFCKLWRLNKVIHSAGHFKKITVRIQDVLIPFILLLTLNFSILTFWSFLDPLRWSRVELQAQDTFGRATESVGACKPSIRQYQVLFLSLLGLSNLTALGIANWQSYKARNVVSDLSETTSINLSMLFMTEATILGMPVLFLVIDDPSAFFLVKSVMISVLSFGVMLPIFVPKLSQLQMGESGAQSRRHTVYFHSVAFPIPSGIAA